MKKDNPCGESFKLDRSVINITSRCTLRCRLCVSGCPYFENPPHYSFDVVSKTIDAFFDIVDHVRWYEFSGGEPLLHTELPKMVEKAMEHRDKFDKLLIITNGTLMPSKELENVLIRFKGKILIQISHYGCLSIHADKLAQWLSDNGIGNQIKIYHGDNQHFGGWVDYGDFSKKNRSLEELREIFQNCGATKMNGNMTTHNGKMHWCVPSARLMSVLKQIPDVKTDYIDLFDDSLSVEIQRKKLTELYQVNNISACDYCEGFNSANAKRYPAGEQI